MKTLLTLVLKSWSHWQTYRKAINSIKHKPSQFGKEHNILKKIKSRKSSYLNKITPEVWKQENLMTYFFDFYRSGFLDSCLHLYCYIHNVSADMTSGLFQVQEPTWQIPVEGQRTYRLKHCEYNNKNENNSPKTLNDKNQVSFKKIR